MRQEEHKINERYNPHASTSQHLLPESTGSLEKSPAIQALLAIHNPFQSRQFFLRVTPDGQDSGRTGAILFLLLTLVLILGVALLAGWEFINDGINRTNESDIVLHEKSTEKASIDSSNSMVITTQQEAAITRIEPAIVRLEMTTTQGQRIGAGVLFDAKGDIVTNNHVIAHAQMIHVVLFNGDIALAQLIGQDEVDDLAVIRIHPFAHMTVAQFGDSSRLVVGQEVIAIGNSSGIKGTATHGIVSALNRSVIESTGTIISHTIQTEVAANPGNGGGALINLRGEFVGIPTVAAVDTASRTATNLNFAIPSNLVATAVQRIVH